MRGLAKAALIAIAIMVGALTSAPAQQTAPNVRVPPVTTRTITPLGWYALGSIGCAAVSPMIATVILGRELTLAEAYHTTLGCMLGPVGWLLADAMFPPTLTVTSTQQSKPPRKPKKNAGRGRNFDIPPAGETRFANNEVLIEFSNSAGPQVRDALARALQLTQLETESFRLTERTISRWRIDGGRSVAVTLRLIRRDFPGVTAGQANKLYVGAQAEPAIKPDATPDGATAQYVVRKLHLLEAHRINKGDDVLVAVIDSKIDRSHPDLTGVIADEFDAIGSSGPAHSHGTAIAGAIAANSKLVGVAPRVRLLAVRAFAGSGESAQSTTFNILKSLDWAASRNARIINMSFAGPPGPHAAGDAAEGQRAGNSADRRCR